MRLRFKQKDTKDEKFHYIIHSSWKPEMEATPEVKSSLKTPAGTTATPTTASSILDKANASVFMTLKGMTVMQTVDSLKTNLKSYLKSEHSNLVTDIRTTKKPYLIVLYCDSWNASNTIANTYKEKFMNHEVSFSLFSKTDPAAMQS